MAKKIAIIGREPTSQGLAPWEDGSWDVWTCGSQAMGDPRITEHFELHNFGRLIKILGAQKVIDYRAWLSTQSTKMRVWLAHEDPELPACCVLDPEPLVGEFGPYVFTSSVSWMLAMAITLKPQCIGIWGVDMTDHDEYAVQRPGCQFLLWEAQKAGIPLLIPHESDLAQPPALYGFREFDPFYRKHYERLRDFRSKYNDARERMTKLDEEMTAYKAAIQLTEYELGIWGGAQ